MWCSISLPSNKKESHYLASDPKLTEVSRNSEPSKTTIKYLHRLGNTIHSCDIINKFYPSKNQTKTKQEKKTQKWNQKKKGKSC